MDKEYIAIKYALDNGKLVKLEVPISVKDALESSERQEQTQQRKNRRYGLITASNTELDTRIPLPQQGIVEQLVEQEESMSLKAALAPLTGKQRHRLILYFWHGWSSRQIAEKEKVSANSVRVSIRAALRRMREMIQD